jgi:uncharacterized membrane protein YdjX (TVP38/TMEM64 family)
LFSYSFAIIPFYFGNYFLENIRKEKIKGKIIRSRVQWIEEGENLQNIFVG